MIYTVRNYIYWMFTVHGVVVEWLITLHAQVCRMVHVPYTWFCVSSLCIVVMQCLAQHSLSMLRWQYWQWSYDGVNEKESEPGDGDEELGLIEKEKFSCKFFVGNWWHRYTLRSGWEWRFVVYWLQDNRWQHW